MTRKEGIIKIHNPGMKPRSDNQNEGKIKARYRRRVQEDPQYKNNTH